MRRRLGLLALAPAAVLAYAGAGPDAAAVDPAGLGAAVVRAGDLVVGRSGAAGLGRRGDVSMIGRPAEIGVRG